MRMIIHVDMDAFYASVEQRDNPDLRGVPLAVGGSPNGRGVVAAASYEARKFGVYSAMSMRKAISLCPELEIVRPRIGYYADISKRIRMIMEEFTPVIEPLSLDEAFLDVSKTDHLFGGAVEIAKRLKSRILSELNLVASVGVAPNKFLAKIASDLKKPNAMVVVQEDEVESFLAPLPIERIWGIGNVTSKNLKRVAIHNIAELRRLSVEDLKLIVGNSAQHYWELARGIDRRSVVPYREAKTVSSETTFPEDITEHELLHASLSLLVESVSRRLRNHGWKGKGIEIRVKYNDFQSITRSMMLVQATDITTEFLEAATKLFDTKVPFDKKPVRLIGFGIHHLAQETLEQLSLFDQPAKEKQKALDQVTDSIAAKFGTDAIHRGKYQQAPNRRR